MRSLFLALVLAALASPPALSGAISIPVPECEPAFEADSQGLHIRAAQYSLTGSPGNPELLFKEIHVVLPPNVDPSSVSVTLTRNSTTDLAAEPDLAPVPPIVTVVDGNQVQDWGENKQIVDGRNVLVYGRDAFYPQAHTELAGVGSMRKWRLARVRYYPYLYNPVARRLEQTRGGEIEISYSLMSTTASAEQAARDDVLSDAVAQLAANFPEARNWYTGPAGPVRILAPAEPQPTTNYVILTTSAIAAGSTKLAAFASHKSARGFSVAVVTESQWGGGTGDAAANNIRAYLKANYAARGFRYVLLIGDPNPTTGAVPMKMLWPRRSSTVYREAPSDYFYADLTGNWDLDRDNYYGEGDDLGPGGCDLYPEVIVGRIPFYANFPNLDSILQKVIDYESGAIGGAWVRRALMSAKPSDASTPGYHLFEAIKNDSLNPAGFGSLRVYEQTYGLSPAPDYTPCNYSTVLTAWNQHAGFHFWWTHGNETLAADIITSDRTQYLDDRYPVFTFQCSCLNAIPENPNNLAYALLKRGAIATNAATRVSWYYPGQISFTNTDSNAGMTYKYAQKLIRDHLPCGDAHYQMMVEIPNEIWMNHLVFNIYGDPSVAYAAGPTITHTPHPDTDIATQPYVIDAEVVSNGPLKQGSPAVRWNTNGGSSFTSAQMSLVSGTGYRGQIPAQPYGTTVYYYVYAEDSASRVGLSPASAPDALHSFNVRTDSQPPTIQHTPISNTGDTVGPYVVRATVTDNTGVGAVTLYYHRNAGPDAAVSMAPLGDNLYEAQIPGPSAPGDVISYYIAATDSSLNHNSARDPSPSGYYSFAIPPRRQIAVLNTSATPPCFIGSNSNAHQQIADILNADPAQRFQVTVLTSLSGGQLAAQDALVLPDNGVLAGDSQSVSDWFTPGKTILTLESSTSYAACSGLLWPQSAGSNGFGTCWDTNAAVNDQEIVLEDPITAGYSPGQVIESRGYTASFIAGTLPSDARVLSRSKNDPSRAYAAYRDVPGKGRIVALGPYIPIQQGQYSMIREALAVSPTDRSITLTSPPAGAAFEVGETVNVQYRTSGYWPPANRIKLEYMTGLDTAWRPIQGAQSLSSGPVSFGWNTTGLPGSDGYKVRASLVGGSVTRMSPGSFTIAPVLGIARAKSVPDGGVLKLKSKVVTCDAGGIRYIQEPNRMAGIKVNSPGALAVSALVTLAGKMTTVNGERVIDASTTQALGTAAQVAPLLMRSSALGGGAFGAQQAVVEYRRVRSGQTWSTVLVPAHGLNNIGLFVRLAGRVTGVGADHFYIDDGSNCNDGSGTVGVRVMCGNMTKPALGSRVVVTGISSTYYERGCLWRALLLPAQSSLQVLR